MKIHVTQTYTITTEHEVDLTGRIGEDSIQIALGLPAEYQTHAVCDALRSLSSDKFRVIEAGGTGKGSKTEIK